MNKKDKCRRKEWKRKKECRNKEWKWKRGKKKNRINAERKNGNGGEGERKRKTNSDRKGKIKFDIELRMKELEMQNMTIKRQPLDSGAHFDVTKLIRLVPPFQEKEIDKYFLCFEKVAENLK